LISCKKELNEVVPYYEKFTVKNGIFSFKKMNNFKQFMQSNQQSSVEEFSKKIQSIHGFTSLSLSPKSSTSGKKSFIIQRNSAETILSTPIDPFDGLPIDYPTSNDEFVDETIMDPYLRLVLNSSRELMIEELVLRVTEFGTLVYESDKSSRVDFTNEDFRTANIEDDIALILPPRNFSDGLMNMSIGTGSVCKSCLQSQAYLGQEIKICLQQRSWNIFGEKTACTIDYANRRRARGIVWSQNLVFYCSIGIETRNQRRVLGIWWAHKADMVSLTAKGEYTMEVNAVGGPNILSIVPYTYDEPPVYNDNNAGIILNTQYGNVSIAIPLGNGKVKSKPFKALVKFKIKKHESHHEVHALGTINKMKIKIN